MRLPIAAAVAALAIPLGACGAGGGSDQQAPPDTVVAAFLAAIVDHDGVGACKQLTVEGQTAFAAGGPSCSSQIVRIVAPTKKDANALKGASYSITRQSGSTATVKAALADGDSQKFTLVLENDGWKIKG